MTVDTSSPQTAVGVLPAHLQQLDRNQDPEPACLKGTLP